jgi:type I restriction enzyme S subunit
MVHVEQELAARLPEFAAAAGDVLVGMTGDVGEVVRVRPQDLPLLVNQRVGKCQVVEGASVDQAYLYYLLSSPATRSQLRALAHGSVQPNLSADAVRRVYVPLPELQEQRRIAGVLGALDDLIDTNHNLRMQLNVVRRAMVAEATSRASVRVRLGDVAEHLPGKYLEKSEYEGGGRYVVFGSNSVMGRHTSYLYEGPLSVLARIGSNCGALAMSVEPAWINNNASAIRSKSGTDSYLLHGVLEQVDMDRHRGGSGQPFIRVDSLMGTNVPWLEEPELSRVEVALGEMAGAEHALAVESQEASTTRDELLPLLLSGRVRVGDVAA